jgi:hypothetical protein
VVAYPDGIDRTWHYGQTEIDDIAFTEALIDHLVETLGVDPFFSRQVSVQLPGTIARTADAISWAV